MEVFLMVLCMSLLGVAVSAIAFGAATRGDDTPVEVEAPQPAVVIGKAMTPAFFAAGDALDEVPVQLPLEVLLRRLETHVRLEQAAAESFLMAPSAEALHTRTSSPLVH